MGYRDIGGLVVGFLVAVGVCTPISCTPGDGRGDRDGSTTPDSDARVAEQPEDAGDLPADPPSPDGLGSEYAPLPPWAGGREPSFCGEGVEGRFQFVRTGECNVFAPFSGPIPICYPEQSTPVDWKTPSGGLVSEPIPADELPELECFIETGCPEFLRGIWIPTDNDPEYAAFVGGYVMSDGSLVLHSIWGPQLLHLSPSGELLTYDAAPMSLPNMLAIPGSDDVLVALHDVTPTWYGASYDDRRLGAWELPDDWCGDREVCYSSFMSRRRPDGGYVWSQPFWDTWVIEGMTVLPGLGSVLVLTDPSHCAGAPDCDRYLTRLSLETGELQSCETASEDVDNTPYFVGYGPASALGGYMGGIWLRDFSTGERHTVSLAEDEFPSPFGIVRFADGTFLTGTSWGIVHFASDGEVLARDVWFDERDNGRFFGGLAVTADGWIVWATKAGLVRFRIEDIASRNYTLQGGFGRGTSVHVAQDGVVIVADARGVTAFADGETGLPIWRLRETGNPRWSTIRVLLLEDDTMVLLNAGGGVTWWRHTHGGFANTPAPYTMLDTRRLRSGPFATGPEIERRWVPLEPEAEDEP